VKRSRPAWVIAAVLVAAWVVAGITWDSSESVVHNLTDVSLVAAVLCPAAFIVIYTVMGLTGSAKWWRNDIGTNIVWMQLAEVMTLGILAYSVVFHSGQLLSPALVWAYIGGLLAGAVITVWRSVIWLRAYRKPLRPCKPL
jgi:hypothetical protein